MLEIGGRVVVSSGEFDAHLGIPPSDLSIEDNTGRPLVGGESVGCGVNHDTIGPTFRVHPDRQHILNRVKRDHRHGRQAIKRQAPRLRPKRQPHPVWPFDAVGGDINQDFDGGVLIAVGDVEVALYVFDGDDRGSGGSDPLEFCPVHGGIYDRPSSRRIKISLCASLRPRYSLPMPTQNDPTDTFDFVDEVLTFCLFQHDIPLFAGLQDPTRFAHYTSAATAMSIIQAKPENRAMWLRNATEMNDFSEIEFGQHCFRTSLTDVATREKFKMAIEAIDQAMLQRLSQSLDNEATRIKANTYLLSLAHHDIVEQQSGILSMWRAYGGNANICMILRTEPLATRQSAYDTTLSPVRYGGVLEFQMLLNGISERILERADDLKKINPDIVEFNIKRAIDFMVLSTKHPSFHEEKEWRVIYRPPEQANMADVPSKIVCVGGIVQKVYLLPMINKPEHGIVGAELHEILDKIIIGPTPNPALVRSAFVDLLREAGIEDAENRVIISGVPLRR